MSLLDVGRCTISGWEFGPHRKGEATCASSLIELLAPGDLTLLKQELEALAEVEVFEEEETYWLRTELKGVAGKVLSPCRIRIPGMVRPGSVPPAPPVPD